MNKTKISETYRADFPIFSASSPQHSLTYLDSAATTQKPAMVIDAMQHYYKCYNANIHRGIYQLSVQATELYEGVRKKICDFLHASSPQEIIFTKGATESINLVAASFGEKFIQAGDVILLTEMEHHSNIVPWQRLCEKTQAKLEVIPVLENGILDMDYLKNSLHEKVKFLSVTHMSNVLGTVNPIKEIISLAHAHHIPVLIDGTQAVPHLKIDIQDLDCDFYVCSSHKCYGPTGVGVLYGKQKWLEAMPPYQSGGDMVKSVSFAKTEYAALPFKFEAGTSNIAGVIGFGAALDYMKQVGMDKITLHEQQLLQTATQALLQIPGLKIQGTAPDKKAVISFVMPQAHAHDIATILDQNNIAIRAGHHCTMPLLQRLQVPATVRVSLGIYNTDHDIERLIFGLNKVLEIFC